MKLTHHIVVWLAVFSSILGARMQASHARDHTVRKPGEVLSIALRAGVPTTIRFKSSLLQMDTPPRWKVEARAQPETDTITFLPPRNARDADLTGDLLVWTQLYNLHIHARPATAGEPHDTMVIVHHAELLALCELRDQKIQQAAYAQAQEEYAGKLAQTEKLHASIVAAKDAAIAELKNRNTAAMTEHVDAELRARLLTRNVPMGGEGVLAVVENELFRAELMNARHLGDRVLLEFEIENRGDRGLGFEQVQGFYEDGERDRLVGVTFDGPDPPPDGLIAVIPPRGVTRGIATLASPGGEAGPRQVSLSFKAANLVMPVALGFSPTERYEEKQRERRARQNIVSVRLHGGAYWISDGVGASEKDATSFTGLGVRWTKGYSEALAFEVEVIGGRTGQARFEEVPAEDTLGTLTRSAVLGRGQFAGILRFGDKLNPYARAGLGLQGGSYDGEMSTEGSVSALDSDFEFNAFVTLGGGVDVRLGDQFLAGIAATAEVPLGGDEADLFRRSIGLAGHLGYAW